MLLVGPFLLLKPVAASASSSHKKRDYSVTAGIIINIDRVVPASEAKRSLKEAVISFLFRYKKKQLDNFMLQN